MINPIPQKIKTVSDFQRRTKPTFDEISQSNSPVLVINRSIPVGVFMNADLYNDILEAYYDYIDARDLANAVKKQKKEKTYSLQEVAKAIK